MALFGCRELINKSCNDFYSKDALIVWNVAWMPFSWNVDMEQSGFIYLVARFRSIVLASNIIVVNLLSQIVLLPI